MHFEAGAAGYDRARPPYPEALWERIRELDLLRSGQRALDLGAGSGQATGGLLSAGMRVTAVEPGPRLAGELRASHPAATVIVARTEDAELPTAAFDIAVAATSIHWMDLAIVLPKVRRWLVPGGRFLVWRNVFGDSSVTTPFRERVEEIVSRRDAPTRPGPDAENARVTAARLTASRLFTVDDISSFRWSVELDDRQIHRLFGTFSDWTVPEVDRAAAAVRELGGTVTEHYRSWLIALSPADQSAVTSTNSA